MEDLKEWESKHWGKKKFADENFVKVKIERTKEEKE